MNRGGASLTPLAPPMARESGDSSPAIICQHVFESIGVHANGDIVCWDADVRGDRVYGNVFKDRIADVYNGPAYREIREWFLKSRPGTWCPAVKRHCSLRAKPAQGDKTTDGCRVKVLRLEPVTYCNLHCPVCPVETSFKNEPHVRETRAHRLLPVETMVGVIAQLPDLELIEYFGFGEPFLHKGTVPFLRQVKQMRPDVLVVTNTSGTVITPAQIDAIAAEALMHRVIFSIDGATPESYRKYRIGGTFSKAFGKMKALVERCRCYGTWHKHATKPGGVQVTWQYILFQWNDSDEELALARELAQSIGVPIEWVITSGYGASKRFLHGSADAMKLIAPPDFTIHMSANADIDYRLKESGIESIYTFCEISGRCDLLALPYQGQQSCLARFTAVKTNIIAPRNATVQLNIDVENCTGQTWDVNRSDCLRLGVRLQTSTGGIRELDGIVLPGSAAQPNGQGTVALQVQLPDQSGKYRLVIDVVKEGVCWFSDRGSKPLVFSINIPSETETPAIFEEVVRCIKNGKEAVASAVRNYWA